jgi:class 3 adenylate cyclase
MDIKEPEILLSGIGSIKNEEIENEKKIHIARISVFILVFFMASIARLSVGVSLNMRFVLISSLCVSFICLALFLWHHHKTKKYFSAIKYYLVTLDIIFISLLVLIIRYTMSRSIYEITTDIPAFLVLFFINAMSGLRFDFKLSLYCAVASVMILIGFTLYDYQGQIITHPYLAIFSMFKGIILLGIALVSGYIGKSAKKLIVQIYKEQEEKSFVKNIFGKYVTPEIRDKILDGSIPLNGERVEATVLFADLRDFTAFVEKNAPEEVIKSMRTYFTAMQKAIRKHKGLVLQYVGDEIEAAFGVPLSYDAHAKKAVMAALEMKKRLKKLNSSRIKEGKVSFRHGIGIHTGVLLAGNTGSEDQPSYALIGDAVNVASRLQGLTKDLGTEIIISATTRKRLDDSFQLKELQAARIRGRSESLKIFAVDGIISAK